MIDCIRLRYTELLLQSLLSDERFLSLHPSQKSQILHTALSIPYDHSDEWSKHEILRDVCANEIISAKEFFDSPFFDPENIDDNEEILQLLD